MAKASVLTLVGKSFAKKGFRFYYQGKNEACTDDCKLYQTCQLNLHPDTVYEVIELIKINPSTVKTHTCPKNLHEEEMVLVRVQIPDLIISIPNKEIFIGSTSRYSPINCDNENCPNYEFCVPELMIKPKDKIIQKSKIDKISDCTKGQTLSKVKVEVKKE
jgi:uncharacterized protein (UPF0179 family)